MVAVNDERERDIRRDLEQFGVVIVARREVISKVLDAVSLQLVELDADTPLICRQCAVSLHSKSERVGIISLVG